MANVDPNRSADCSASGTEPIAAWVAYEGGELALCGHHLAIHKARLAELAWIVEPFGLTNTTPGVGTESTGQHFALQGD